MLVLAGAGSGKTGVVTKRIARLIQDGTPATAILAMTFTNKAAAEMQERVTRLVGRKASKGLLCCTFHRFGLEVLRKEARALGVRGGRFAIFDRGDCVGIVRDAMRSLVTGKSWDMQAILNRISLAKNAFIDPQTYAAMAEKSDDPYDELTALCYPKYADTLRSLQAFDFDDLVCEPVLLWRRREDVRERWQMRFRYLIVDEYQDTNQAQLEMLRSLATAHQNLCVVGDDDQAIYAWRGADVRNILDFEEHFRGTKVVRLQHNYRSSEAVLTVANAVLEASTARRHDKRLIPTRGEGAKVKHVVARDGTTEARFVAEEIHRICDDGRAPPREIAVLYRSNLQAGELESELKARGVPYQLFGGTQTFERKEVKDVLAYLRVLLTGAGKVFSAGADLDAARAGLATSEVWERLSAAIAALPGLTIAALNGTLAGGAFGMALACDLRIAVPEAKFFYPVMKLGYLPQPSDPARLAALVGPARAKLVLMGGARLSAEEALRFGLVDRLVPSDGLHEAVRDGEVGRAITLVQSLRVSWHCTRRA